MHIDRGLLRWGLFLIVLGAVPLAVQGGYVEEDVVRRAWELWPLILVGVGLGLLLRRTEAALLGGIVISVTLGLMGGAILAVGVDSGIALGGCSLGSNAGDAHAFTPETGTLGEDARVRIELSCGDLGANTATGSGWTVSGSSSDGGSPDIEASTDRLDVRSPDRRGFWQPGRESWVVTLPTDVPFSIDATLNAGSASLDLAGAHVRDANVSVNAGSAIIDLGGAASVDSLSVSANAGHIGVSLPAASVSGRLSANAGSIDVCVPAGVGVRFSDSDNPLSGNNFGSAGLVHRGSSWISAGYDTAPFRIDLSASANAGSINLNPEDGCE